MVPYLDHKHLVHKPKSKIKSRCGGSVSNNVTQHLHICTCCSMDAGAAANLYNILLQAFICIPMMKQHNNDKFRRRQEDWVLTSLIQDKGVRIGIGVKRLLKMLVLIQLYHEFDRVCIRNFDEMLTC